MARPDRAELVKELNKRENLPLILSIPNSSDLESTRIIKLVAAYFNLAPEYVLQNCRKGEIIRARHWAMFLMRQELNLTLTEIGKVFSYKQVVDGVVKDIPKDHATVLHAHKKITGWIKVYPDEAKLYEFFKTHIY